MDDRTLDYLLSYMMRTLHTSIRIYSKEYNLIRYYGDNKLNDPLYCDISFAQKLIQQAESAYPKIYLEVHPLYYAMIQDEDMIYVIGPINIDYKVKEIQGKSVGEYVASVHSTNEEVHRASYCDYYQFCEEVLLLFNLLKKTNLSVSELNYKNFNNGLIYHEQQEELSQIYFRYQEKEKLHNPYVREMREMNSIKEGNTENLIKSIDEEFEGEYAVLSRDPMRSKINLGIVGLAISARAAIEGGISPEEAYSINDSYIIKVDSATNAGQIDALVRQAKIQYAEMVYNLNKNKQKNYLIEKCKDLIYKKMHSKIVISELAQEMHVSLEYLSSLFKKKEGITISQYIMKTKINFTKNLLMYSDYNYEDIAYYFGFCSQSHFSVVFKKWTGITPKQFRDRYGIKEFRKSD